MVRFLNRLFGSFTHRIAVILASRSVGANHGAGVALSTTPSICAEEFSLSGSFIDRSCKGRRHTLVLLVDARQVEAGWERVALGSDARDQDGDGEKRGQHLGRGLKRWASSDRRCNEAIYAEEMHFAAIDNSRMSVVRRRRRRGEKQRSLPAADGVLPSPLPLPPPSPRTTEISPIREGADLGPVWAEPDPWR